MLRTNGERKSGKSVLSARLDDDDDETNKKKQQKRTKQTKKDFFILIAAILKQFIDFGWTIELLIKKTTIS